MGVKLRMKTSTGELFAALDRWEDQLVDKVLPAALNELADRAESAGLREVTKTYGLAATVMREKRYIRKELATPASLKVGLTARGPGLGVYLFRARETKKGVTFRIKGKAVRIPHAFFAKMKSGHVGVFARGSYKAIGLLNPTGESFGDFKYGWSKSLRRAHWRTAGQLPINELRTAGPAEFWRNKEVVNAMHDNVAMNLDKVIRQQLVRFAR